MESLLLFLWGSFIPYNVPVYPGVCPLQCPFLMLSVRLRAQEALYLGPFKVLIAVFHHASWA